jgi:nucleoside-diphosphate-sugar epimerase
MLSGKTFLITGSTGRLGREIVSRLEELGANVLPLVLEGYPFEPKRGLWTAKSDRLLIGNPNDLNKLPTPDYVINFHWRVDRNLPYPRQLIYELDYNIHRPSFLWEWLSHKAFKRFINISSIKVFSHLNENPISADTEPRPVTPYGIAKFTSEKFFDAYFCSSAFSVVHLRMCSVASFNEHPSQLMSQLCNSALGNFRIRINIGHIAYIIYIDEAVDLIINAALTARKDRYIIAADGIKIEEIATKFEEVCKCRLNAEYVDFAPGAVDPIFITDIEQLRVDWTRSTLLESMIMKIACLWDSPSSFSCDVRKPWTAFSAD